MPNFTALTLVELNPSKIFIILLSLQAPYLQISFFISCIHYRKKYNTSPNFTFLNTTISSQSDFIYWYVDNVFKFVPRIIYSLPIIRDYRNVFILFNNFFLSVLSKRSASRSRRRSRGGELFFFDSTASFVHLIFSTLSTIFRRAHRGSSGNYVRFGPFDKCT